MTGSVFSVAQVNRKRKWFELLFCLVSALFWIGIVIWFADALGLPHIRNSKTNMSGVILIIAVGIPLTFLSLYQAIIIANTVYAVEVNDATFTMRRYFFNDLVLSTSVKVKLKLIAGVRIFKSDSAAGSGYANIVVIPPLRLVVIPGEILNMKTLLAALITQDKGDAT